MAYRIGAAPHFHVSFRNPHTGAPVDPATVLLKVESPSGTDTTLTYGVDGALTKQSTGKYTAIVVLNEAGTWHFRWETTGTYQGVEEFSRLVEASEVDE